MSIKCHSICTHKKKYRDFVVYACDTKGNTSLVIQRLLSDIAHWIVTIPKLSLFRRSCILPKIMGRWYTRKHHLSELLLPEADGVCYCQQ